MTSLLNPAYRSSKLFISLIEQRAASSRLLLLENGASMLLIAHAKNLRARHNYFLSPGVYRIDFRFICFFPSPCYTPTPGHLHVLLFSRSVMSDSLRPHGLRHSRLPCPPPSHRVGSNSCPLSWWCHPTTSSSATPLLLLPSIFPSIKVFPMSQLFTLGGQSIGASALASVLLMNIQGWFPLGLTGWTSLQSKGLSRVFSNTTVQRNHSLAFSFFYCPALTSVHDY